MKDSTFSNDSEAIKKEVERNQLLDCVNTGIYYLNKEDYFEALDYFKQALNVVDNSDDPTLKKIPPLLCSYYGFCVSFAEGKNREAEYYCKKAVARDRKNPLHYYHLGRIYIKCALRRKAFGAFQKGLSLDPTYQPILSEISKMGVRRAPVISFLPRNSWLNILLGKCRAKFSLPPALTMASQIH